MRPPHISRSFSLLTVLMAIPLLAIVGYIAYDRYVADASRDDGWKTYRNERFRYEFRYPPDWQVIYEVESLDQSREGQTVIVARERPFPSAPGAWPLPHVFAAVNFQGDWCVSTLGMTS